MASYHGEREAADVKYRHQLDRPRDADPRDVGSRIDSRGPAGARCSGNKACTAVAPRHCRHRSPPAGRAAARARCGQEVRVLPWAASETVLVIVGVVAITDEYSHVHLIVALFNDHLARSLVAGERDAQLELAKVALPEAEGSPQSLRVTHRAAGRPLLTPFGVSFCVPLDYRQPVSVSTPVLREQAVLIRPVSWLIMRTTGHACSLLHRLHAQLIKTPIGTGSILDWHKRAPSRVSIDKPISGGAAWRATHATSRR